MNTKQQLEEKDMDEKDSNARLAIYTPEFLVNGFVKVKARKIGDRRMYSRRVSDVLCSACERMAQAGEPDFLELRNADLQDLRTNQIIKGIKSVVINKSAIRIIVPGGHLSKLPE